MKHIVQIMLGTLLFIYCTCTFADSETTSIASDKLVGQKLTETGEVATATYLVPDVDLLRGYVSKDNERKWSLPFTISVTNWFADSVSINLHIDMKRDLRNCSDVFLYAEDPWCPFWLKLAPSASTADTKEYAFNLPRELTDKMFVLLACDRQMLDDMRMFSVASMPFKQKYMIRLGSYVPAMSIPLPPATNPCTCLGGEVK